MGKAPPRLRMSTMDDHFDTAIASDYELVAERCEDELARMVIAELAEEHRTVYRRLKQLEAERRPMAMTYEEE